MTLPCSFTIPAMECTQGTRSVEPSQKVLPRKAHLPESIDTNVTDTGQAPDALYFGTIIDVQGTHGSLIPHLIDQKKLGTLYPPKNDSMVDSRFPWIIPFVLANSEFPLLDWETFVGKTVRFAMSNRDNFEEKLVAYQKKLGTLYPPKNDSMVDSRFPWIIPFVLANSEFPLLDWETFVGKTVRFAMSNRDNFEEKLVACNIRPVLSTAEVQEEISKSRNALLICNQARQESFAKAMEDIKMISPRNVPVIHHLDLIQYAANLDSQGECSQ
ncbi:hypothetical protein ABG067_004262 [Albugo candida]